MGGIKNRRSVEVTYLYIVNGEYAVEMNKRHAWRHLKLTILLATRTKP